MDLEKFVLKLASKVQQLEKDSHAPLPWQDWIKSLEERIRKLEDVKLNGDDNNCSNCC